MKKAFLFSGQGSQYCKMGYSLIENYPETRKIFEIGKEITGIDIENYCFNESIEELSNTNISQPCIMAVSLIAADILMKNNITPDSVGGHSLGEYAALVVSGIVSMEDGFKLIKIRSEAMNECAKKKQGCMYAVISKDIDIIEKICNSVDGYVTPVNYNSLSQTVIAGDIDAVEKAVSIMTKKGLKTIKLNTPAAFHSMHMEEAYNTYLDALNNSNITFKTPTIPFYSNIDGMILTDISDIKLRLAKHIISPVRFTDELTSMQTNGISHFIECGPGKVISGLIRKTLKNVTITNVEDKESFEKTLLILKE